MQVSWIDADRLRALVAQLEVPGPLVEKTMEMVELDTTSASLSEGDEPWGFAMDWKEPSCQLAPAGAGEKDAFVVETRLPELQDEAEEETANDRHDQSAPSPEPVLPLSRIREKLRAIRQRAADAGILTRAEEPVQVSPVNGSAQAPDEPGPPVFEAPPGSRSARLAAFAGWARQVLHEDSGHVLVMKDDGEVLWGGEARSGLALSTMMAWGAAMRTSAFSACESPPVIHQSLASGNVLTVIPCVTSGGMVHAAVAAPEGLTHKQARVLRGALCIAMDQGLPAAVIS